MIALNEGWVVTELTGLSLPYDLIIADFLNAGDSVGSTFNIPLFIV
jgi:hypothetical protein